MTSKPRGRVTKSVTDSRSVSNRFQCLFPKFQIFCHHTVYYEISDRFVKHSNVKLFHFNAVPQSKFTTGLKALGFISKTNVKSFNSSLCHFPEHITIFLWICPRLLTLAPLTKVF